jgi:hypothetical protein
MRSVSILLLIVLIICWYVINNVLCKMVESLDVSVALNRVQPAVPASSRCRFLSNLPHWTHF